MADIQLIKCRIAQAKEAFFRKRSLLTSKNLSLTTIKRFVRSFIWTLRKLLREVYLCLRVLEPTENRKGKTRSTRDAVQEETVEDVKVRESDE